MPHPTAYKLFELDNKLFTFVRNCYYPEGLQLVTDQLYYLDYLKSKLYRCVLKANTTVKDANNYFNDSLNIIAIQNHLINSIIPYLYKQKIEQIKYYIQTNLENQKSYSDTNYLRKTKLLTPISFVVYLANKQLKYATYNPTEKIWIAKSCIPEILIKNWQKKKKRK